MPLKIIIFSLAGIGNTLLFTPALRLLREGFPEAQITVVVMSQGAKEVLEGNPNLDELILWEFPQQGLFRSLKFVWRLRKRGFDISINPYPANRPEYNLISFLVYAPKRLGHRYAHRDILCLNFLNNLTVWEMGGRHDVQENLALVELLGVKSDRGLRLELYLLAEDREFAESWLVERGLVGQTLVGFHPGTSRFKNHKRRRWPLNKFARLGHVLTDRHGAKILVFAGPEEKEVGEQIVASLSGTGYLITGTTMRQTAALIQRCRVFVSNDSGLMHTAAALRVPTVAIFGPTNPAFARPYGTPHEVVRKGLSCSPCFFYSPRPLKCDRGDFVCVNSIAVEEVLVAVERLILSREDDKSLICQSSEAAPS